MAKLLGHKTSKEDADLAEAAKRKAGGPAALARMFGVTLPAASEWGRIRPIPRHLRPRIEDFVGPSRPGTPDEVTDSGKVSLSELARDLLRLLEPDPARSRLAELPRRYWKRYDQRVSEVIARVKRELEEYQRVLEAEHLVETSKRRTRSRRLRQ